MELTKKWEYQYLTSTKNRPQAGTDIPAAQRLRDSITCRNSSNDILPLPTSMSVPTTARTILRKKRLASMQNTHSYAPRCSQCASTIVQIFVLTSVCVFEKLVKSLYSDKTAAAAFIASKSGTNDRHQAKSTAKGDLRSRTWYSYRRDTASKRACNVSATG